MAACGRDVATGRRCGTGSACAGDDSRRDGGAASAGNGAAGGGNVGTSENELAVHVEDVKHMTVELITLACAGDCADVQAVAHGGRAPYSFVWEDGTQGARRHVCLDASATLTVTATDTAVTTDEFRHDAQTVSADVKASVLDCSDGGAPMAGGDFCIENPSFEGTLMPLAFDAPPWNNCVNQNPDIPGWPSTPDLVDASTHPGTDGTTYASMGWAPPLHEFITQKLCAPLLAGHSYSFLIDLATATDADGAAQAPAQLAVYGSASDCLREHLLWKSPPLDTQWTTYCVTLTPEQDASYITLEPTGEPQKPAFATADNIVPVVSCP
ncbi:MAG TPA: hypothetical protein VHM19_10275 [Polyangiales bacterium]|nr:hypothetical protein [Polyangiales bacterium]